MKLNTELSEALLSEPDGSIRSTKVDRPSLSVTVDKNLDLRTAPRQFSRQYAHSYTVRLWTIRPKLEKLVKSMWKNVELKKISELCEFTQSSSAHSTGGAKSSRNSDSHGQHISFKEDVTVAVIGTVFKYQPEKPSILQDLAEENPMVPVVLKDNYTSERDTIQLEDETTRVHLVPTAGCGLTVGGIVNGVICAVKGKPNVNGKFEVKEVIYPTPNPRPPLKQKMDTEMVFISGLEMGRDKKSFLLVDLLFDYLCGLSGSPSEVDCSFTKKTRVFIVGDSFCRPESGKEQVNIWDTAKQLDEILDQLCQTMDVFILPGENDGSESMLPQVPLHRCVFPQSSRRPTFRALTNPARIEIPLADGKDKEMLDVLLSSGQNVKDAVRNSESTNALEMAQKILEWGYQCPTAPDTLPLHPGVEDDVFFIDELPHVFAVGNQPSFDAVQWKNTQIFTIPKFSETGCVVLLNGEMELIPIKFQVK